VALLLPSLIALLATAFSAAVSIRALKSVRSRGRTIVVLVAAEAETRRAVRGAQGRMLLALVLGLVAAIAVANLWIGAFGIPLTIAPGVGAAIALVSIVASPLPRRQAPSGIRRADLTAREATTFGPRWAFVLPVVAAVLLVALVVATGATAELDSRGLARVLYTVVQPGQTNAGSPYPGWYYGAPILIVTGILVGCTFLALRRVAAAPRNSAIDFWAMDDAVRSALTRFVMFISSGTIVLYLGAVALQSGSILRSGAQWSHIKQSVLDAHLRAGDMSFVTRAKDVVHGVVQPQYTTGAIETVVGLLLIGVALTLAILAIASIRIRWSVSAPSEPEKVDA